MNAQPYAEFIAAKAVLAPECGFEVEDSEIHPLLKPHQRDIVRWAVRRGRAALFESFGLGKTMQQLEVCRLILAKAEPPSVAAATSSPSQGEGTPAVNRAHIVAPLGVRQEFMRDAGMLGIELRFVRSIEECGAGGIYLTNYETVRDGKLDPREFTVVSLDEAGILRGFGGTKTFRTFMGLFEASPVTAAAAPPSPFAAAHGEGPTAMAAPHGGNYRFVATATPSPNEYIELLAYAAFLGVMDVGQAKTRFFKRDASKADKLTLHPHKEREFWLWMASWAIFVQKPSDLCPHPVAAELQPPSPSAAADREGRNGVGCAICDEGYELPPLDVRWHEVGTDHREAGMSSGGQHRLLANAALGVVEASREKRLSLSSRIAKLMELRAEEPAAHRVIWHDLEAEREAIEDVIPAKRWGSCWDEIRDGNTRGLELYERHYSAYQYADGRVRELFMGPGEKTVLLTPERDALFGWRKFNDDSGQVGINCSVFRNEGTWLSSYLIETACWIAWKRWPDERLYTYVNPDEIESENPGYCFKAAGWRHVGETKGGLHILEALPADIRAGDITARSSFASVYGAQDDEEKLANVLAFADGAIQELAAKPVMLGSGVNFQRHCHWAVFLGIGFKFNDFIQAIHRLQRFQQTERVRIDLIYTEAEREVRTALEAKWRRHEELVANMTAIIREFGLAKSATAGAMARTLGVVREEVSGNGWTLVRNDCVAETSRMEDASVDLILTSIPFSTQYEYSPAYEDFGHTDDEAHFWEQMDYLTSNLFRVLKPGRCCVIHVKDRIAPGGYTGLGFQTVQPFHASAISHYLSHGFAYLGMQTITTDVVRENNQTYRLGWTEQCKDGSRMGVGMPEYLLRFRRPPSDSSDGYADEPVVKSKAAYSRARWQTDASGHLRSSGERLLSVEDVRALTHRDLYRLFRRHSLESTYDYEEHVAMGETLEAAKWLPVTFQLLPPHSWHEDVWSDVTRMRTLNGAQYAKGREMHICPMQFDVADRVIAQMSMPGEVVFDPFGGIGTVPLRAVKLGRKGLGCELAAGYHADAVYWLRKEDEAASTPTLFDLVEFEPEIQEVAP